MRARRMIVLSNRVLILVTVVNLRAPGGANAQMLAAFGGKVEPKRTCRESYFRRNYKSPVERFPCSA